MKKYICLRDDDTSYFTLPEELIEGYGSFWGKVPITLATVPFINGNNARVIENEKFSNKFMKTREWELSATVEDLTEYHSTHPIGLNSELVEELKKQIAVGKIEIAQHGVNHLYNERGAEMFSDQVSYYAIRAGKEYLEKVFDCPVETFIAPSNTVDRKCSKYIDKLGMNLFCCKISYRNNFDRISSFVTNPSIIIEKLKRGKDDQWLPIKNRNGIKIFGSITFGSSNNENEIYSEMVKKLNYSGFVALCTHYYLFKDLEYRKNYQHLIGKLLELDDVEFVTAKDYYRLAREKFYEKSINSNL